MTNPALCIGTVLAFTVFMVSLSTAEVPADYKGKPYGGTPKEIPGRINVTDYDLGGVNIAWKCDNKAGSYNSVAGPRQGDGETEHPAFYQTNHSTPDLWPDGSIYPSAANPGGEWYIGAAHATDYINVTVHVAKAGKYWISTTAASDPSAMVFHFSFNGVNKSGSVSLPGTSNYHLWKPYDFFASVSLDSGVQVMQFYLDEAHMNYDYFVFSSDSGKVGLGAPLGRLQPAAQFVRYVSKESIAAFSLPDAGNVRLSVFDCAGRRISKLSLGNLDKGSHIVPLRIPAPRNGVYLLCLERNGREVVKKFSLCN